MKRLGKYSGKVYEEHEIQNMDECGTVITDEQAADKDFIKKHHMCDLVQCVSCFWCPTSKSFFWMKDWFHRKINTIYSGWAKIKQLYIVYIEDHYEKVWRPDHDDLQKEKLIGWVLEECNFIWLQIDTFRILSVDVVLEECNFIGLQI